MDDKRTMGSFDIAAIAASLPESATTLLVDRYLTDRPSASARVFRVYRPTPPHYHAQCDEYLYVFSGRGTFWMGDPATKAEFGPGQLLHFERGTVHALPDITRGAAGVPVDRYAAARSQGCHLCRPGRRYAGELHSTGRLLMTRGAMWAC